MQVSRAVDLWLNHHRTHSRANTVRSYESVILKFLRLHGGRDIASITTDDVMAFLNRITANTKPFTKRSRYSYLTSFFNFVKYDLEEPIQNPCDAPLIKKLFRPAANITWNHVEKEIVDEVIFKTKLQRDRLLLELMARGGMRIGEVLKLEPRDVEDQKLSLRNPKSGRPQEHVFLPRKVAIRLQQYITAHGILENERIFKLSYAGARAIVIRAGKVAGIHLRPHDLRRFAATHASRSGVPIEIVSKVILRHRNLSTTQRYLGPVSDTEAVHWIESIQT